VPGTLERAICGSCVGAQTRAAGLQGSGYTQPAQNDKIDFEMDVTLD
jgi:hypothetical protein